MSHPSDTKCKVKYDFKDPFSVTGWRQVMREKERCSIVASLFTHLQVKWIEFFKFEEATWLNRWKCNAILSLNPFKTPIRSTSQLQVNLNSPVDRMPRCTKMNWIKERVREWIIDVARRVENSIYLSLFFISNFDHLIILLRNLEKSVNYKITFDNLTHQQVARVRGGEHIDE